MPICLNSWRPRLAKAGARNSCFIVAALPRFIPYQQIVSTLSRQLHWSHFLELLYLKEPLARDFYVQMCSIERWSVRALRKQVGTLLFERTMAAKQPEKVLEARLDALKETSTIEPDVLFKDPYLLDFLKIND